MDEMFTLDQSHLRDALKNLLVTFGFPSSDPPGADIHLLLQVPGKLLAPIAPTVHAPAGYWALLSLFLTRYSAPTAEDMLVSRVALACELLHSALDTFDDLEDDDRSEVRTILGDGRFLNAGTILMTLVPLVLEDLAPLYLPSDRVHSLQHLIMKGLLVAMRGQQYDLLSEQADLATFEPAQCMQIATAKSATLFQLVCQVSLEAVHTPEEIIQLFVQFGQYIGIIAQLENDVHDLEVELTLQEHGPQSFQKSDLRRQKKTLPIVLAHRQLIALQNNPPPADTDNQGEKALSLQQIAFEQAIIATFGTIEYLHKCANQLATRIVELSGKDMPAELCRLLKLDTP
jgi:geranylgeranyl pyrophosphate synthase